jgi:hypothetical protein
LLFAATSAFPLVKVTIGPVYPEPFDISEPSIIAYSDGAFNLAMNIHLHSKFSCIPPSLKTFKAYAYDKKLQRD